jgi:hypothetical protein
MPREGNDPTLWTFSVGPRKGERMILVEPEHGHWLWQGRKQQGYGMTSYSPKDPRFKGIKIGRKSGDRHNIIKAHQLTWFLAYGNPPENTELSHHPDLCMRRSCCNPEHLRAITHASNAAEMFYLPKLSVDERVAIEEAILDDQPLGAIADYYGVSVWSVRIVCNAIDWRAQLDVFAQDPTPF